MPRLSTSVVILALATLGVALAPVGVGSATSAHPAPSAAPLLALGHSATNNYGWSGYAISTTNGNVTEVGGSWVVPYSNGSCPSRNAVSVEDWLGIDGFNSGNIEAVGTGVSCALDKVTYSAAFIILDSLQTVTPPHLKLHANDTISAEVRYVNGHFHFRITDVTTGASYSTNMTAKSATNRSSAEWIVEASGQPLLDFGSTPFGGAYTGVTGGCAATIGGVHAEIGHFGASLTRITMVNYNGTAVMAAPTILNHGGTSFDVVWKSAGP